MGLTSDDFCQFRDTRRALEREVNVVYRNKNVVVADKDGLGVQAVYRVESIIERIAALLQNLQPFGLDKGLEVRWDGKIGSVPGNVNHVHAFVRCQRCQT